MTPSRILIMGAAGRDFHNFNVVYRQDSNSEVVAFTATQIPNISGRRYPPELAGPLYPKGIPIYAETELPHLIRELKVDRVVFAYSDISHAYVMHKASEVLAAGADYCLLGPRSTQLVSVKPVVSISAVRTGSGKSQTTRRVVSTLQALGYKVAAVRHPMPYGDLARQAVQRYGEMEDLVRHACTIEEREEYEPHIMNHTIIYSGVDYERILREAEKEADIIVWDGGNNDFPFFKSDLQIVVADPHRPGHELNYHPGETNLRLADIVIINKVDTARSADVTTVRTNIRKLNPHAAIVNAASPISVDEPAMIAGRSVLVVEDGPTLTHGEMAYGAGVVAARKFGAREIIDPRPYAVGSIQALYEKYPSTGPVLPAMGYGAEQIRELEETIRRTPAELVIIATPIDLRRVLQLDKPSQRVRYELQEIGQPTLRELLREKFSGKKS